MGYTKIFFYYFIVKYVFNFRRISVCGHVLLISDDIKKKKDVQQSLSAFCSTLTYDVGHVETFQTTALIEQLFKTTSSIPLIFCLCFK